MRFHKIPPFGPTWCLGMLLIFAGAAFTGCRREDKKADSQPERTKEETEKHEEGPVNFATLTRDQMQAVGLKLGKVEEKELTATVRATGRLKVPNRNKATITSMYGGVIRTLNIEMGAFVRKGEVIATIAHPQFIQVQEEYLTVSSRITFAEQEQQRQRDLNEGNVGALKNLQNAEAELKTLRTRKASLFQQIRLMGIDPDKLGNDRLQTALRIVSPISGTVGNVFAKIGSYVDVASPVAEVVDNSRLHLDLNVFEKDLPSLKVGQIINFQLTNYARKMYKAKIFNIGAAFENDSKTIPIHCDVYGDKTGLIDGMNITASISLENVRTPAVPNEAIVEADGKYYLFMVADKKPEAVPHDHSAEGHTHPGPDAEHTKEGSLSFEKIEIVKGVSELGYTGVVFLNPFPEKARIVTQGAFFVNAKMANSGGHAH